MHAPMHARHVPCIGECVHACVRMWVRARGACTYVKPGRACGCTSPTTLGVHTALLVGETGQVGSVRGTSQVVGKLGCTHGRQSQKITEIKSDSCASPESSLIIFWTSPIVVDFSTLTPYVTGGLTSSKDKTRRTRVTCMGVFVRM